MNMSTIVNKQQTVADLRASARYIEEHGWTQGRFAFHGKVCAAGAMGSVTGVRYKCTPEARARYIDASVAFGEAIGGVAVSLWNDNSERVEAEVLAAFEKAALWVEEQA